VYHFQNYNVQPRNIVFTLKLTKAEKLPMTKTLR